MNNNGYLLRNNHSNKCDPYRAPTTRISCNMGDCESPYLWQVEPWSKVRTCLFWIDRQSSILFSSVHPIAIVANKFVVLFASIDEHLNQLMIVIVFLIDQWHVSIVMDSVSSRERKKLSSIFFRMIWTNCFSPIQHSNMIKVQRGNNGSMWSSSLSSILALIHVHST